MNDTPPDRLSNDPASPYYHAQLLERTRASCEDGRKPPGASRPRVFFQSQDPPSQLSSRRTPVV